RDDRAPRSGAPKRDGAPRSGGAPKRDGAPQRDGAPNRDGAPRRDTASKRDGAPRSGGASKRDGVPARDGAARRDGAPKREGASSSQRREGAPRRDGASSGPRREGAGTGYRGPRPAGAGRPERPNRPEGDNDRPRHDDPVIPETITGKELDRIARNELKTLAKENADRVAQHLVMAGMLIDEDAPLAHRHAQAAARRAGRIALTRETLAITAYATGDFALALRELRTYRRISGSNEQLPLMVDCERGLGRPEKALELGRSVDRRTLSVPTRVELAIAMSGARLDLGQTAEALMELEIPQLDPAKAFSYSPALFDAYAIVLDELGRTDEADEWARRADLAAEALESADREPGDETIEIVELDDDVWGAVEGAPGGDPEGSGFAEGTAAAGAASTPSAGAPSERGRRGPE
ncbi:MAG: hypothetical protein SFU54_03080, partial [Microcella sp.]|nr:hypothetical protein [Microcella sp.]